MFATALDAAGRNDMMCAMRGVMCRVMPGTEHGRPPLLRP